MEIEVIEATISHSESGRNFKHFWSVCVGAGRANEGLRAAWLEQLKRAHDACGFKYCRFHGLFHDDMFVYRINDGGEEIYNFQYLDELFDRMLAIGVKPFVEFGFCPGDMASERATNFWWKAHGSPPKDYGKWAELIDRTTRHWIERYGIEEVRSWYFEVWNEANLRPFFTGTRAQYFELYRSTVLAVKAIDPSLRVGGPATSAFVATDRFAGETEDSSKLALPIGADGATVDLDAFEWKPPWLDAFFSFCSREKLPVDFISCHPYPTGWALDWKGEPARLMRNVAATPTDLRRVRQMVDASPFPNAEIHLTEWNSSPSPRDFTHDYLQAATFIVRANVESIGLVDSLAYWTFTDVFEEGGAGDTAFHGGFGMINYQGIAKPAFHAYRFLNALGDELIHQQPGLVITRRRDGGRIVALAYHYPAEVTQSVPASLGNRATADATLATGSDGRLRITLHGLPPLARVRVETLNRDHGNAHSAWQAMGAPSSPTQAQLAALRSASTPTQEVLTANSEGILLFERTLSPWSVLLLSATEPATRA